MNQAVIQQIEQHMGRPLTPEERRLLKYTNVVSLAPRTGNSVSDNDNHKASGHD